MWISVQRNPFFRPDLRVFCGAFPYLNWHKTTNVSAASFWYYLMVISWNYCISLNLHDPSSGLPSFIMTLNHKMSAGHKTCLKLSQSSDSSLKIYLDYGNLASLLVAMCCSEWIDLPRTQWALRPDSEPQLSPCCKCWADDSTGQFSAGRPADPACMLNQGTEWKRGTRKYIVKTHIKII